MSSYGVDIHCDVEEKVCLRGVPLKMPPCEGHVISIYEQSTFEDGESVNEAGEEAPDVLVGRFRVVRVEIPVRRFGPDYGSGDHAYCPEPPTVHVVPEEDR